MKTCVTVTFFEKPFNEKENLNLNYYKEYVKVYIQKYFLYSINLLISINR